MHKILFLLITFLSASFAAETSLKVYAAYDANKVGEMAMVNAVVNEIKSTHPTVQITVKPNATSHDLEFTDLSVMVTAGQFGINLIKSSVIPVYVKVLLCTHQWFDAMNDLCDIYIALPEYAINETIQNIATANRLTLLPTLGVLHTMSEEVLATEDTSVINLKDAKVGVVLGGDAELPDGGWKVFTADNAHILAEQLAEFQKVNGYKLLITNGPRTGRSLTAHRNGVSDQVSSAFIETLQNKGLIKGEHFEFFDFQFPQSPDEKSTSALKAVIKTILDNKGFMIVPGESTSSISEILAIMPAAIYKNDAMNTTHELFVDQLVRGGTATLWPQVLSPELMESYAPPPRQEVAVVAALLPG